MPKFKYYDKEFANLMRTDSMESEIMQSAALRCKKWHWEVGQWSQLDVQEAVYKAEGYIRWQMFRVSLKGQSTHMKILRLALRKAEIEILHRGTSHLAIEQCRIDNYIGALHRGGLLNNYLEVVR